MSCLPLVRRQPGKARSSSGAGRTAALNTIRTLTVGKPSMGNRHGLGTVSRVLPYRVTERWYASHCLSCRVFRIPLIHSRSQGTRLRKFEILTWSQKVFKQSDGEQTFCLAYSLTAVTCPFSRPVSTGLPCVCSSSVSLIGVLQFSVCRSSTSSAKFVPESFTVFGATVMELFSLLLV